MTAKSVRHIVEDCVYTLISGSHEFKAKAQMNMVNRALEQIRAALPSEQEMMLATATVWCLPKHSKKQIDPELSKDMVVAISELMISKLQ